MAETPVTRETVANLPDAPLEDGVSGIPELSAHVAILSRKSAKPAKLPAATNTERAKP